MDVPVWRSGRRLCARINYPLPLIDCQCLCVWKPPSGPDVNNCRNSGCGERRDRTQGQNIDHMDRILCQKQLTGGKKGEFLFIYFFFIQPVLLFRCLIMPSCCTLLKQEMSESSQDPADASDGISFLHWLIKCSLDGRSTGFDFKDPSYWLEDLFKKKKAQGEYLTLL